MIIELNKHQGAIKLERKQFEAERERMLALVNQMDIANREQKQLRYVQMKVERIFENIKSSRMNSNGTYRVDL